MTSEPPFIPPPSEQPADVPPPASTVPLTRWDKVEQWLGGHAWAIALVLVGAGMAVRLQPAVQLSLNADEAYNYLAIDEPTLGAALRSAMTDNPHPPLYYVLLYLWRQFGDSDFWLRLLSLLAGTATIWVVYHWLARAINRTTAIGGAFLLAFATQHINLSAELRAYTVLLLLLASAFYFMERALAERSALMMVLFSLALALAILDDYSAAWAAVAAGVYVIFRLVRARMPASVVAVWAVGQALCAGTALLLYRASVASLRGTDFERWVREVMLKDSYRQPGEHLLAFLTKTTSSFFHYLASTRIGGWIGLALFAAGIALLALRGVAGRRFRALSLFLVLSFVFAAGAAATRMSPFGGTRHSMFLFLPAVAGIGFTLSFVTGHRLRVLLPLLVVMLPLWKWLGGPDPTWFTNRHNQRREYLLEGVRILRNVTRPGDLIFSDQQSHLLLRRYFCPPRVGLPKGSPSGFTECSCNNIMLVGMGAWGPTPDSFVKECRRMQRVYGLRRYDTVWVFSAGWGRNMAERLKNELGLILPRAQIVHNNVAVFSVVAAVTFQTEADEAKDAEVRRTLEMLAGFVRYRWAGRFRFGLWPGRYQPDLSSPEWRSFPAASLTYAELYRLLAIGRQGMADFLPAVAFWVFGDEERHPGYMRLMEGAHDYSAGGLRFTLLALARDAVAGVYLVEAED